MTEDREVVNVESAQIGTYDGGLVGEASEMGFTPGEWPLKVTVLNAKGVGFLFFRAEALPNEGGFVYVTRTGDVKLTVFND